MTIANTFIDCGHVLNIGYILCTRIPLKRFADLAMITLYTFSFQIMTLLYPNGQNKTRIKRSCDNLQNTAALTIRVFVIDCNGVTCLNGATLNVSTCKCECLSAVDSYIGNVCECKYLSFCFLLLRESNKDREYSKRFYQ